MRWVEDDTTGPGAGAEYHARMEPARKPRSNSNDQAVAWGLGLNFVYGVIGFGGIGWALQTWVWRGTAPWLLLAGVGLGLVGGTYRFVRDAIAMNRS